ncbi:MAG TPA: prolyl oligopeptidase family serine peptidase [Actinophytocola sp.]|uniref:alpha/beta hydrolase family protein n=1 Tax=Actinophytocola sp. TaxID=1872138 RepID=UPI002DB6527F|nr:prolyl oligopeptidase family serine peptidase [Actinophytocola sp.]HEU5475598.1 prolyl oligopeptidase family serine peptidase [Actinophytocola sp.]
MAEGKVSAWNLSPQRTLIALRLTGEHVRIGCWWLDPSGRIPDSAPVWTLTDEQAAAWEVLGWAGPTLLVLWRRHPDRNEVRIVDQRDGSETLRLDVVGRPVAARVNRSGRVEILLAVSDGRRPVLCAFLPDSDSYLVLAETDGLRDLAAWDADAGHLVVNIDPRYDATDAVRLFRWDGHGYARADVGWPDGVIAARAAGHGGDVVGLTGTGAGGASVPGLLHLPDRTVRWFPEHTGYSTVDVAPTGAHVLAATWIDEGFRYRMLDGAGTRTGELNSFAGLATSLSYTRDELHLIGSFQSPVLRPALGRWLWRDGDWLPLRAESGRTPTGDMRWAHRWIPHQGDRRLPEWVFEPAGGGSRGTVLYLPGGPRGRLNQGYEPVIAALVDRGWSVVGMNYPGSTGYGPEYSELSQGDWGGVDAEAVERRARALHAETGGPLCLYGHGYGGYLALLVASRVPRLVSGVAVLSPMVDLIRLLATATGARRRWLEDELGELRYRPRELLARSPVSRLTELAELPLLVGHGRRDERCPVAQSRQLVRLLEITPSSGIGQVRYLEDPDGTHVPSSWCRWIEAVLAHFEPAAPRLAMSAGGVAGNS